ncbi:unnamed protein product [Notodromas monacha]|uniref:Probable imidazolonepropionase n=1 Tax=Notodromas monacha TaxID=399045 RepID=A0A7R9BI79_9CRUS|nr:unnamed protein product [Notodromas monacha]CAG0914913.1 unnamed protein product [Notodromas monacha]
MKLLVKSIKQLVQTIHRRKSCVPETNYISLRNFDEVLDVGGKCVVPGLIDGHTHPVWSGDRVHEFAMKLAGATYLEIHQAGGGINFTVAKTKEAEEQLLLDLFLNRVSRMMRSGTTLVECKSGYGLEWETEFKMLRVLEAAKALTPVKISSTYCAAHSVPQGKTPEEAADDIVMKQIPALQSEMQAGRLGVDSIDVFCEKGVYELEDTKRILLAGRNIGLRMNFHGDELHPLGGGELGGGIGAEAISHLEQLSEAGIQKMAASGTCAVLLPTTALALQLPHPPVRKMIQAGIPVALGSDFNPNAFCLSMIKSKPVSIFVKWENLIYQLGMADDLIAAVIIAGQVVHRKQATAKSETGLREACEVPLIVLRGLLMHDAVEPAARGFSSVRSLTLAPLVGQLQSIHDESVRF